MCDIIFVGPFFRVFEAKVKIGNDGTDNDVKIRLCSDVNTNNCCTKKLSHTFSDDWKKNKLEVWDKGQFGDCAKKLIKVKGVQEMVITLQGIIMLLK